MSNQEQKTSQHAVLFRDRTIAGAAIKWVFSQFPSIGPVMFVSRNERASFKGKTVWIFDNSITQNNLVGIAAIAYRVILIGRRKFNNLSGPVPGVELHFDSNQHLVEILWTQLNTFPQPIHTFDNGVTPSQTPSPDDPTPAPSGVEPVAAPSAPHCRRDINIPAPAVAAPPWWFPLFHNAAIGDWADPRTGDFNEYTRSVDVAELDFNQISLLDSVGQAELLSKGSQFNQ